MTQIKLVDYECPRSFTVPNFISVIVTVHELSETRLLASLYFLLSDFCFKTSFPADKKR
jgi:hypothetical protein